MRAVMAECLGLLALGGLEESLQGLPPSGEAQLTYQDFGWLRPNYAESTWRVSLSRMAQRRLVIKTYQGGLTAYQLSKEGWEQWRVLNPVFSRVPQKEWGLLLFKSLPGQKPAAGSVRRVLQAAGYEVLLPGVAISPKPAYSDYLVDELRRLGYQAAYSPIAPDRARPVPISELLADPDRSWRLARDREKISRNIEELLTQLSTGKTLKNQTKERIGSVLISGLTFFRQLNWYDQEVAEDKSSAIKLARQLDLLMRQYSTINHAWKV